MSKRVLIVDDEADLSELLAYNLRRAGYDTRVEPNGLAGLAAVESYQPHLVVLDLMMPEMSGLEVAQRLKKGDTTARIPIIMLTARTEERDELAGLDAGADDYVTKPFSMKVLEARIEAVLRRAEARRGPTGATLQAGTVRVDTSTHEITVAGEPISFTNTEFRLLRSLLEAEGRVLSRQSLIETAMGPGVTVTERTIDVHVTAIRRKLRDQSGLIRTVRGVGYRLDTSAADSPADEAESETPDGALERPEA